MSYYSRINEDAVFEAVKNGTMLTSDEVHFLVAECACEEGECGEHLRWHVPMYSIINVEGEHYILYWLLGLTEYQEDEYEAQYARKVQKVKRVITVEEWEEIE
jgi:hypothetical protein